MNEFFNWHDTSILFQNHWMWMLAALAIGIYVGWRTCENVAD
jgi:hypothetical protein